MLTAFRYIHTGGPLCTGHRVNFMIRHDYRARSMKLMEIQGVWYTVYHTHAARRRHSQATLSYGKDN